MPLRGGAYEVSVSIAPSDGEVVGADALPTLALGGMALCGIFPHPPRAAEEPARP